MAQPASASPTSDNQVSQANDKVIVGTPVGDTCFGYTGVFRPGTTVRLFRWTYNGEECFGIGPNKTIHHAWPGSRGWPEMPYRGLADQIHYHAYEHGRQRHIVVWVRGSGYYCVTDSGNGLGWQNWYHCTAPT